MNAVREILIKLIHYYIELDFSSIESEYNSIKERYEKYHYSLAYGYLLLCDVIRNVSKKKL